MTKVILTAPATEMSEYNGNPAIAFVAGFPKPLLLPRTFLTKNLYRAIESDYSGARCAPLGLRRIEASLIDSNLFKENDVAVVHPDNLEEAVDETTRVIGIGVKDPLGLGYVSLTYSTLLGLGEPVNRYEFFKLLKMARELKSRYDLSIVVGGPGVWQLYMHSNVKDLGIDVIVDGEGETVAPKLFADIIEGRPVERIVKGDTTPVDAIPCIRGATIYGAVEISRGCGRGCMFCTPTMQVRRDIPLEKIMRDVEVNLENGQNKALLITEDVFLYGAKIPWEPNRDAIEKLIDSVTKVRSRGLEYIQITHLNLAAARYRKDILESISDKLYEFAWYRFRGNLVNTVEVGIESGSPKIIARYMRGKTLPYRPEDWPSVVLDSLTLLEENGWIPLATIIVGMPGEDVDDAYRTLSLIEDICRQGLRTFLVPLLFVPLGGSLLKDQPIRSFNELNEVQISIFSECWKHNTRVWSVEHFKSYSYIRKKILRILAGIYLATVAKEYRWRKKIATEIYKELVSHL
ncbi:MAG: radical SAM protein [Ignisphaera sp.]|nr:B12-binding domain-containing radical SAM protein [Ignisphaera sp.]MDW8084785.1 radical SAM protein [Ignisphaera sp.]